MAQANMMNSEGFDICTKVFRERNVMVRLLGERIIYSY